MEDGGVDTIVIESRQHKMAEWQTFLFFYLLQFFYFKKHYVPQLKSQTMRHALVNLLNTTLLKKYVDPLLKLSIYGSVPN